MNPSIKFCFVKALAAILFVLLFYNENIIAQIKIYHSPLGYENLYEDREIDASLDNCEREPRDPIENKNVFVKFKTFPIFNKQEFL
jgi:hypothetical protein